LGSNGTVNLSSTLIHFHGEHTDREPRSDQSSPEEDHVVELTPLIQITLQTLQVTGSALVISAVMGVALGAGLGLNKFRGRSFVVTLVYTGMGFPPVVVGLVIYLLLSRQGPLGSLGWLFTPPAMVLAQIIIALPLVASLTMGAIEALDPELRMQIRSLGATRLQTSATLLFEARAGVIAAIVAGFGGIISEVGAAMLVGGNIAGETRVLSTAIVLETRRGHFGLGLALGGVLLSLAFVLNWALLRLQHPFRRRR
jgi:tungstate transport system permease protein